MELGSKEQKVFWENMKDHDYNAHSAAGATIRLARKFIGANVLDAGAGDGTLGKELRHCHADSFYAAIDIAPASSSVIRGDIFNLKYRDSNFDTIFCLDVLEHLTVLQAAMAAKEMKRVLKKDGFLIVTCPYEENLASNILACPFCEAKFHKSGHQQRIDLYRLRVLLAGFEIVKTKVCNLGFINIFGFIADLFYKWKLEKIFKHKLLTKNIFVVARKL